VTCDGLEELAVPELRERGQVLGVVPVGTYREKRRPGPWMVALGVARAAAQYTSAAAAARAAAAAAARAQATVDAAHEARCARPRARTLNTASHDGWQSSARGGTSAGEQKRLAGGEQKHLVSDGRSGRTRKKGGARRTTSRHTASNDPMDLMAVFLCGRTRDPRSFISNGFA
jgi:hypothetical protein